MKGLLSDTTTEQDHSGIQSGEFECDQTDDTITTRRNEDASVDLNFSNSDGEIDSGSKSSTTTSTRSSNFSTREPTVGHNELESVEMESGTNTNTSNSNTTDTITNQKC